MTTDNRVYINATSCVSCAGESNQELLSALYQGNSGIKVDMEYIPNATPAIGKIRSSDKFAQLLQQQCQKILESSFLEDFSNTLLIVGSSVGGMDISEEYFFQYGDYKGINPDFHNINTIAHIIQEEFKFLDTISFSTACTSSANALGYGHEVLKKGVYETVLVVGADALTKTTVGGFLSLGVLSSSASTPFDKNRDGMNVAEGVACLLLEREKRENSIELCGVGYSSDAHNMTHPHPDGLGAVMAMEQALKSAGLEPEDIDYINAHGTGTLANDKAEAQAIETLFQDRVYVSSTKSITGHTLGAAGALEAIISYMAIKEGVAFKNAFLVNEENSNINLIKENQKSKIKYAMSNSFAFGGNNCSLILGAV